MICLCCGKKLNPPDENQGWHKACIRRFFGTNQLPEIDLREEALLEIARSTTEMGVTIPGVQKKMSLHLFSEGEKPRLTIVDYPAGFILKPSVEEYEGMPEAEQLAMSMAERTGISVVPHALMKQGEKFAYITKRVDRVQKNDSIQKLAMEDFCQLTLRQTADKYRGSYERCDKVMKDYSCQLGMDRAEFFLRLIFNYVIGNSDMHLKNFSLIEYEPGSGRYQLSPAYDLLPIKLILPEDEEDVALALNGKKQNLRKKDFMSFAAACQIPEVAAGKMMKKIISLRETYLEMCEESFLPEQLKGIFLRQIDERISFIRE